MKNMTNTNPATNTNATVNFRAPINVKMPITVNFSAPINLTYNGGKPEEKPLEKITAEDLQRYICERLEGQWEGVPAGWPAPKKNSCTAPTNNPAPNSDCKREKWCTSTSTNVPTNQPPRTGVAEVSIDDQIKDAIVRQFGFPRHQIVSVTPFKSCYDMYAVGTTGDVTFLVWRHQDGDLHIRKQNW